MSMSTKKPLRISETIAFAAGLLATTAVFNSVARAEINFPLEYRCDDGTRVAINVKTENATIWLNGDRTLMLPARYAQGRSWFWQVEPQEEDCTAACIELSFRGPPKMYVIIEGVITSCTAAP